MELDHSVAIEVIDDGPGVDPADAQRIFEPYQTAHPSLTQPGSVGLRLPIARQLARKMGGDVECVRRGESTVFRLTLPKPQVHEARRRIYAVG